MKLWKCLASLALCLALVLAFVPAQAEAATVAGGICDDGLTWTLDDAGKLTVSGTGPMMDYGTAPWYAYRKAIRSVVIGQEITAIGSYAFSELEAMEELILPDSITTIGSSAFAFCSG